MDKICTNKERLENLKTKRALKKHLLNTVAELKATHKKYRFLKSQRNMEVITLWNMDHTHTYQSLGDIYGVSRERIRQILNKARSLGFEIRSTLDRTKHLTINRLESVIPDVVFALSKLYGNGTAEYFEWRDNFFQKHPGRIYRKLLQETLTRLWKQKKLDPLDNYKHDFSVSENHMRVLNLRMNGVSIDDCKNIMGVSKPMITNYLRDLKQIGLYSAVNPTQVEAVKLDQDKIQKKLDWIRSGLIEGKTLAQLERETFPNPTTSILKHFISRHHAMPKIAKLRYNR